MGDVRERVSVKRPTPRPRPRDAGSAADSPTCSGPFGRRSPVRRCALSSWGLGKAHRLPSSSWQCHCHHGVLRRIKCRTTEAVCRLPLLEGIGQPPQPAPIQAAPRPTRPLRGRGLLTTSPPPLTPPVPGCSRHPQPTGASGTDESSANHPAAWCRTAPRFARPRADNSPPSGDLIPWRRGAGRASPVESSASSTRVGAQRQRNEYHQQRDRPEQDGGLRMLEWPGHVPSRRARVAEQLP